MPLPLEKKKFHYFSFQYNSIGKNITWNISDEFTSNSPNADKCAHFFWCRCLKNTCSLCKKMYNKKLNYIQLSCNSNKIYNHNFLQFHRFSINFPLHDYATQHFRLRDDWIWSILYKIFQIFFCIYYFTWFPNPFTADTNILSLAIGNANTITVMPKADTRFVSNA